MGNIQKIELNPLSSQSGCFLISLAQDPRPNDPKPMTTAFFLSISQKRKLDIKRRRLVKNPKFFIVRSIYC